MESQIIESEKGFILALMDERFRSIAQKFEDKDLRDEQRFQGQTKSVEAAFAAANAAVNAALSAAEKAVTKAEIAAEKRFDSVNEFRGQLKDQTATFIPRQEAQVMVENISERVKKTEEFQAMRTGEMSAGADGRRHSQWTISTIVSTFAAIIAVVAVIVDIMTRYKPGP